LSVNAGLAQDAARQRGLERDEAIAVEYPATLAVPASSSARAGRGGLHAPAIAVQDVVVGGREGEHLVDEIVVVVADGQLGFGTEDARRLDARAVAVRSSS
jgi:hypothetical protein